MVIFLVVFGLLLVSILIVNNTYAIRVVRNQVAQSNKNFLALYMNQIDRSLGDVDSYLYTQVAFNSDLLGMERSEKENSEEYNLSKIGLMNQLSNDADNFKSIDFIFAYSVRNDDLLMTQNFGGSYAEREAVRNDILSILRDGSVFKNYNYDSWLPIEINGKYFFCHAIQENGVYIGAWVNADKLMIPMNYVDFGKNGKALLVTGSNPISDAEFIRENHIDISGINSDYELTGTRAKYLVVGEKSTKGNFSLIAVLPDNIILQKLPYFQTIISFLPYAVLGILVVYSLLLRKIILQPIYNIVAVMKEIRNGNLERRIHQKSSTNEFNLMNETFNNMISQIHDLKIDVYEDRLKLQKTELKHLQLQINPHFFLNSLNVIYQLAQVGNFELIQEMSLCLVRYFRFMFQSNSTFIRLEDELMHIQNYLRIQQLRFPGFLTYDVSVPDSMLKCQIPPLMIQTFVENTIKHGVTMDEPIHISICIGYQDDDQIKILIQDTGKGYSQEVLEALQAGENTLNEQGEHVGIWNVQRRLHMLYQDHAYVIFYNRPEGGACTEITLPFSVYNREEAS